MGRLPMTEINLGEGKQLRLTEISESERLPGGSQEKLLLEAIVRELIEDSLAYQVSTDGVLYLVFPSQPTRELVDKPKSEEVAARAELEGNGQGAYSSLVVRLLSLNYFFNKPDLYHDAAVFNAASGGSCTLVFDSKRSPDASEINVFFNQEVNELTRKVFLSIVRNQVPELTLANTVKTSVNHKSTSVFISYEYRDLSNIRVIADDLMKRNIIPWIQDVALKAGHRKEEGRAAALRKHSIAVFALSDSKVTESMRADLIAFKKRQCRIIPVILPNAPEGFEMPESLREFAAVNFGLLDSNPFERLAEGILDARHSSNESAQSDEGKGHVFLSYFHDDERAVERLYNELIDANISVWWDKNLLPGEDWKTRIHVELKNAYAVVVCFSPESVSRQRSGVFEEVNDAAGVLRTLPSNGLHLIPVLLSTCKLPTIRLGDGRYLDDIQTIDLSLEDRQLQLGRLLDALSKARNQKGRSRAV
jgi:hypothetical protein